MTDYDDLVKVLRAAAKGEARSRGERIFLNEAARRLDAQAAEIAKLEESRQMHRATWKAIDKKRATLVEQNAALREALEKYGKHLRGCPSNAFESKCTCGLSAALKETSDAK